MLPLIHVSNHDSKQPQSRFNFEDIRKLPPPIIAFDKVAFSYSGKREDYLYSNLSFGIEYVLSLFSPLTPSPH